MKGLSVIFTVLLFALATHLSNFLHRNGALPEENHPIVPLAMTLTQPASLYPTFVTYPLPTSNKYN
jgi:hypothetical protein